MVYDHGVRDELIDEELKRDLAEFETAKIALDRARARYDIAKHRFLATKRLADETAMTSTEYWQDQYSAIIYFGLSIGRAIVRVLTEHVRRQAKMFVNKIPDWYEPEMTVEDIVKALEKGGFEFTSPTPMREANAALINMKGIMKTERGYACEDHRSQVESEMLRQHMNDMPEPDE